MAENNKNKLVTLGALDQVATALKNVANKAANDAAAEKERAMLAEKAIDDKAVANAAAIDVLNDGIGVEGSVANAVNVEKLRAEGVEAGFETRIAKNEAFVAAQPAIDKAQNDRLNIIEEMMGLGGVEGDKTALEELQDSIDLAQAAAETAQAGVDAINVKLNGAEGQDGLIDRIGANEANIARLDGDANVEGSVKKQIADESELRVAEEVRIAGLVDTEFKRADAEEKRIVGLVEEEARVARAAEKANKDAIDILNGDNTVVGSVQKHIKDAIDVVNNAAGDLAGRVSAAEGKLEVIQGNDQIPGSIAKAEADAKKYADDAIAALVDSAPEAMNTLNELAQAIQSHGTEYEAYVATVSAELAKKVDKVEGSRLIAEAEATAFAAKAEVTDVNKALQDAKAYADDQDAVIQESVRGLAAVVGQEADGENAATGIFAKMAEMKADCEGDLEDAIEAEVAARNKAIADELVPYAKTDTMKQFVGTVVSSLSLQIVGNQVELKLGDGVDGIKVADAYLDIATDEEIAAILGDLAPNQGE
jgi:hypothetical protein